MTDSTSSHEPAVRDTKLSKICNHYREIVLLPVGLQPLTLGFTIQHLEYQVLLHSADVCQFWLRFPWGNFSLPLNCIIHWDCAKNRFTIWFYKQNYFHVIKQCQNQKNSLHLLYTINVLTEHLKIHPMLLQMQENMLCQTLHECLANTHKIQSTDKPRWQCVLWCNFTSSLLSDITLFQMVWNTYCLYVNYTELETRQWSLLY